MGSPFGAGCRQAEVCRSHFPVLGGLTWRVPVSILVMDGRVAPSEPAADTGNPVKEAAVPIKSQQ